MPTRILHVFTVPLSLMFLRGQVKYMAARGYELSVVTSPGPALDAFAAREGADAYAVPMSRRITPGADARSLRELVTLVRRLRPDIVHAHTPKGGLLGTTAAAIARVPRRIYHVRGLPLVTARGASRLALTASEVASCRLATDVLAVSRSLRKELLDRHIVAPDRAHVLADGSGNGVDGDGRFDPDAVAPERVVELRARLAVGDAPLVGFVGRLVRDKGVLELARAWAAIRARVPAARLVIAGTFEERDAVPADVREIFETDPRVHMAGFIEHPEVLYRALDVVAFPSHREGFPNVPLEAAAMRVPVVAARAVGTVDAVVDGVTGSLVAIGDHPALADAVVRYLQDPALRAAHGDGARRRALACFRRERIWSALADFYDARR